VFRRILSREIKFPKVGREEDEMTPEAHDLINKLLTTDPQKRLGYKNINEIKKHPFFAEIDWDHIMEEEAPFKPVGRDQDANYFPNATDKDEELKVIINDQKSQA
jgi:serine/threonine protein kinase